MKVDLDGVSPKTPERLPAHNVAPQPFPARWVNVAHFMADLLTDPEVWSRWKGQMPVIYNRN